MKYVSCWTRFGEALRFPLHKKLIANIDFRPVIHEFQRLG